MFETFRKAFKAKDSVAARIRTRHALFWSSPDAGEVKDLLLSADDPIEQWKDRPNWQRKLSNKFNAREFARMHGCRVAELYWKGRLPETIDFDRLPAQYVIRPTFGHSCKMVFLMNDGVNMLDKRAYLPEDLKQFMQTQLAKNPRLEFLVEEFLRNEDGEYCIPNDYKFLMFNGEIASIVLINRLGPTEGFQDFYDENWNRMDNLTTIYPNEGYKNPPACLPELIDAARRLSKAYGIFVRIDFYATDKGAVFGEFTPTPSKGHGFTPYGDELLTYYWDTYCNGMI